MYPPDPVIEAEDIGFAYGSQVVFSDLSFTVSQGEKVAVTGRNGVGKSHLLECLAGMRSISFGALSCNSSVLLASNEGFAFNFTLAELLSFVPELDLDLVDRFASALDVDFRGWMRRGVLLLSSGERQLVRLMCVLAKKSDLLLLDEPEVHLDADTRSKLACFFAEHTSAMVVVTHDTFFREKFAEKNVLIRSRT